MKIQPVAPAYVHQVWPQIESFLTAALEHSKGDYTAEHAKVYLATGMWHLIVAVADDGAIKGACAVEYVNRPNDRVAFVTAIGGRLIANDENYAQLVNILKSNGATKLEGAARPSIVRLWKRAFKAREKYSIIEAEL